MSTTLTRRSLVAAAPAAIIATTLPATAGAHPDAVLLALREPYDRTMAVIATAGPAHARAEDAYAATKRARPHLDERALRKTSGLTLAEPVWRRAVDANGTVIERITETPARTLEGLIFKAQVAEADRFNADLRASIVADLVAMGEAHA